MLVKTIQLKIFPISDKIKISQGAEIGRQARLRTVCQQ